MPPPLLLINAVGLTPRLLPLAPRLAWHAQRDLSFILENIHELLNADDYLGI